MSFNVSHIEFGEKELEFGQKANLRDLLNGIKEAFPVATDNPEATLRLICCRCDLLREYDKKTLLSNIGVFITSTKILLVTLVPRLSFNLKIMNSMTKQMYDFSTELPIGSATFLQVLTAQIKLFTSQQDPKNVNYTMPLVLDLNWHHNGANKLISHIYSSTSSTSRGERARIRKQELSSRYKRIAWYSSADGDVVESDVVAMERCRKEELYTHMIFPMQYRLDFPDETLPRLKNKHHAKLNSTDSKRSCCIVS